MEKKALRISSYCSIRENEIYLGGELFFSHEGSFADFADAAYRYLGMDYPKFHKMDRLCKLAFITSEVLLKGGALQNTNKNKVGIYLGNKNSSTDVDLKYYDQAKNGMASPALFVYTLPNIMIGEICIRNGFKGDHALFVSNAFDAGFHENYIKNLFEDRTIESCIAGFVDLLGEDYASFLFACGEHDNEALPFFSAENINLLQNLNKHTYGRIETKP